LLDIVDVSINRYDPFITLTSPTSPPPPQIIKTVATLHMVSGAGYF